MGVPHTPPAAAAAESGADFAFCIGALCVKPDAAKKARMNIFPGKYNEAKTAAGGSALEQQSIYLENRERMTINQVIDVDAFDDETLWANLKEGAVEISGSGLHIEKLDLAEGVLIVSGIIRAFAYVEPKKQKAGKRLRALHAKFRNE